MKLKQSLLALSIGFGAVSTVAANESDEVQDMSDPLAVYTQAGIGFTDKGVNIKIGQSYDTGNPTTMGMNLIELKGIAGNTLGYRDSDEPLYGSVDGSVDSFRYRNFVVDTTNGRGSQIDATINLDRQTADISKSVLQALPKWGFMQLYPLAGVGISFENDREDDGFGAPGAYALAGFYGKFTVNEKIWFNYNPIWLTTLAGSQDYQDTYYAGESHIFTHEIAASYQFTPRFNMRYFGNWNEKVHFGDGDHRLEFNYQI